MFVYHLMGHRLVILWCQINKKTKLIYSLFSISIKTSDTFRTHIAPLEILSRNWRAKTSLVTWLAFIHTILYSNGVVKPRWRHVIARSLRRSSLKSKRSDLITREFRVGQAHYHHVYDDHEPDVSVMEITSFRLISLLFKAIKIRVFYYSMYVLGTFIVF